MSDSPEIWPPKPGPQHAPAGEQAGAAEEIAGEEIAVCPSCKRRLLTQTSALCNWCGAKIDNVEYQTRAAQNRQQRDQQERADLEAVIQEEAQHGILGRLRRLGKQNKNAGRNNPLS